MSSDFLWHPDTPFSVVGLSFIHSSFYRASSVAQLNPLSSVECDSPPREPARYPQVFLRFWCVVIFIGDKRQWALPPHEIHESSAGLEVWDRLLGSWDIQDPWAVRAM